MRGRILWASILAMALVAACTKRDSLYIDSSKDGQPTVEPATQKPGEPAAKPAEAPQPTAAEPASKP